MLLWRIRISRALLREPRREYFTGQSCSLQHVSSLGPKLSGSAILSRTVISSIISTVSIDGSRRRPNVCPMPAAKLPSTLLTLCTQFSSHQHAMYTVSVAIIVLDESHKPHRGSLHASLCCTRSPSFSKQGETAQAGHGVQVGRQLRRGR